jgi:4-amino-4-deoxy-L-arabinose transferase-like glycosyltransferase
MNFLKTYKFPLLIVIIFLAFIVFSVFIRIQGLGYSNFQGDEVNPMDFVYGMDHGVLDYFMHQKRGPVQYSINMLNVALFDYHNEAQIRLPFLIFGILALYTIYKLAEKIIGKTGALVAVVLMAVNGLFIAFSRITQYQSFMYFIIPIGVLVFIQGLEKKNNVKIIIAGLLMSLAFLAHYDTLSVVPFFIAGFIGRIYREIKTSKEKYLQIIKKYLLPFTLFWTTFLIPALIYYIPYYTGQGYETETSGYLENRLFGGGFMPRTGITLKLIDMYAPKYYWFFIFLLGVLGLLFMGRKIGFSFSKKNINIKEKIVSGFYMFIVVFFTASSYFSLFPIKPRASTLLVVSSSILICIILIFSRKVDWKKAALASWFLGAFSFYFFIMKDPRTHVYVSMTPLFIIGGYGFFRLYISFSYKIIKTLLLGILIVVLTLTSLFNWVVFADRNPEYPWWDKDYLPGVAAYRIERVRHKKIEGVFGFNNYRGWEQVADLFKKGCLVGSFNSNEKNAITYFYIRKDQGKGAKWEMEYNTDNLIIVEGPHSWMYIDQEEYPEGYTDLGTIKSNDYVVTRILGKKELYPEGKYLCAK